MATIRTNQRGNWVLAMRTHKVQSLIVFFVSAVVSLPAQTSSAPPKTQPQQNGSTQQKASGEQQNSQCVIQSPDGASSKEESLVHVDVSSNGIATSTGTRLGDDITVAIPGLKKWTRDKSHDYHSLRLVLAGHMLPKIQPNLVNLTQEYVNFTLKPDTTDDGDRISWLLILQAARRENAHNSIPITVGTQSEGQPFESNQYITLQVYPWFTWLVVVGLVLLLISIVLLGKLTGLLRSTDKTSPYSLGRVQMAWWFYLVIAAYLYLWLVTGQVNMLTSSVLTLIGISAATGLSATFVDQQKQSDLAQQRLQLTTKQTAFNNRIAEIVAATPATGSDLDKELQAKRSELAQINAQIAAMPAASATAVSTGLVDIVKDGNGISFSRFQIVVWTLVFGAVFVRAVLSDLTMPQFDATLLSLMGISSGTYVGFKFPEPPK
jgi:hypothetical protein